LRLREKMLRREKMRRYNTEVAANRSLVDGPWEPGDSTSCTSWLKSVREESREIPEGEAAKVSSTASDGEDSRETEEADALVEVVDSRPRAFSEVGFFEIHARQIGQVPLRVSQLSKQSLWKTWRQRSTRMTSLSSKSAMHMAH